MYSQYNLYLSVLQIWGIEEILVNEETRYPKLVMTAKNNSWNPDMRTREKVAGKTGIRKDLMKGRA